MWLGDITYGSDQDQPSDPNAPPAAVTLDNPYVSLAANLVDMIHPYKAGVPVNFNIAPQTQTFLMAGGALLAGLVMLSMFRKR